MLGGYFMASGVSAAMKPDAHIAKAQPLLDTVIPTVSRVLPEQYAAKIPSNKETLVRLNGAALAVGGSMMVLGLGRRLGATIVAANFAPVLATRLPRSGSSASERESNLGELIRDAAVLGGVLIATQDTQGKPSWTWRANAKRVELARQAERVAASLTSTSAARKAADSLKPEGPAL